MLNEERGKAQAWRERGRLLGVWLLGTLPVVAVLTEGQDGTGLTAQAVVGLVLLGRRIPPLIGGGVLRGVTTPA